MNDDDDGEMVLCGGDDEEDRSRKERGERRTNREGELEKGMIICRRE